MTKEIPKSCFVISPIGSEGSETRKRSDRILKFVISEVVKSLGYAEPERSDTLGEPGMITSQIIKRITEDDLVIADLTEHNPNVFYELAIRHMIGKPLIQIIEKGTKIPFDVSVSRTIFIDHKDLESVDAAKEEMKAQIKAVENDPSKVDNPITVSLQLEALKSSDVSSDQILGRIQETLESIEVATRNVDGINTVDEIMNKLEEIEYTVENIESVVEGTESTVDDIQAIVSSFE